MKRLLYSLLFIGVALSGCVGTDVGNPQEPSEVELDVKGYDDSNPNALTLPSGLRIDSAWLSMNQFEFRRGENCGSSTGVVEQPILVDVISNETVTERPMFTTPAGDYCRFDAGFVPWSGDVPEGAPADMAGYSVLIEGARSDGTEFVVRSDMDMPLQLASQNSAFALREGPESLLIGFALNEWFNETTLDNIEANGEQIVIDSNSNASIYGQFNAALRRSSGLFRDENADNALDMSERASELARGNAN
ncbi:MAG: hypothetical protein ACQEVA_16325 [Myxococcota bacterium]